MLTGRDGENWWGADTCALTPRYRLWPDAGYRNAAYLPGAVALPNCKLRSQYAFLVLVFP
jgi:hypothetical protein